MRPDLPSRLPLARALGTEPKVLLLDEPAAGMNTREKADLMVLIRELRAQFELEEEEEQNGKPPGRVSSEVRLEVE